MDYLTPPQRSKLMSRIRGRDTKPELIVRSNLHRRGLRFRLHEKKFAGSPDIVFPRWKVALFVNGCFWHGHSGCKKAKLPSTRRQFWKEKIAATKRRDHAAKKTLSKLGWKVICCWTCELPTTDWDKLYREITKPHRNIRQS